MPLFRTKKTKIWRIQFDLAGRTYVKSSKTVDKKAAERMEAQWKAEIHSRQYLGEREPITVEKMFENYLKGPLAKTTLKSATSFQRILSRAMKLSVTAREFDQRLLHKFVEERMMEGTSANTCRTHMLIFSGAWNRTNKKVYDVPDLDRPKIQRAQQKNVYLTPDEQIQLFEYLDSRAPHAAGTGPWQHEMKDVFTFLCHTGVRANELCTLEWKQIDLKNKTIELWRQKNDVQSYIHMSNSLHEMLQRRAMERLHDKWVFPNRELTNHRNFNTTYLNDVLRKAGLNKTVHQIRHGYITQMLKSGLTLVEAQKLAGHRSIATTSIYAHLESGEVSKKAADILNQQSVQTKRSKIRAV